MFTSRPAPVVHTAHETCECGAEVRVSSAYATTITLQLDAFRAAHAACRVYAQDVRKTK